MFSKLNGSGAKRASVSHDQPSTSASTSHDDQPSTATSKPSGLLITVVKSTNYPVGTFVAAYKAQYRDEIPTVGKVVRSPKHQWRWSGGMVDVPQYGISASKEGKV